MTRRIWDISEPLSPATAVFPGDSPFSQEWVMRIDAGDSCNVSTVRMSVHCGTHTDAPLHFDDGGADMATVALHAYLGRCRVVALSGAGEPRTIPAAALTPAMLDGVERILFKTATVHDASRFDAGFCAVGPEAARLLVRAGVVLVGIDTPSIDHATSKELDTHHLLHRGGVAILENLDLSAVSPGDYELIALPLKIVGGDSSPVRAILRSLP